MKSAPPTSPFVFPTFLHEQIAKLASEFFAARPKVDTVLVVNSCARGRATPESDLDLAVLLRPALPEEIARSEEEWREFAAAHPLIQQFRRSSRFCQVHLDVFDGRFTPAVWDDGGGPDSFEIEIGNRIAYARPLEEPGPYLRELQSRWLPYYGDDLRLGRLAMARDACAYDLDHVPAYCGRGLHFQAFDRLYKALQEFLEALFIARRTYPLAYNKWIREQVEGWLKLPDLYRELGAILAVQELESDALTGRAKRLRALVEQWIRV